MPFIVSVSGVCRHVVALPWKMRHVSAFALPVVRACTCVADCSRERKSTSRVQTIPLLDVGSIRATALWKILLHQFHEMVTAVLFFLPTKKPQ